MKNPNKETIEHYLKRMGVKINPDWTVTQIFEKYCEIRNKEANRELA